MLRVRIAATLIAALALLAAGCGDDTAEVSTLDTPATDGADADGSSGDPDEPAPDSDALETPDPGSADASDSHAADSDGAAATAPAESGDGASAESSAAAAPADAEALVAAAVAQLAGSTVSGEAAIALAPGFNVTTSFASDAEGDLVAVMSSPFGLDENFPAGAEAEVRFVGGTTYVQPLVPADTLAELGLDEAWYEIRPDPGIDPLADIAASTTGLLCVFPQMGDADAPAAECDLLGETASFLEAAGSAEIVGAEDVRGAETTRVRLLVSLLDLAGEMLGTGASGSDGEAGAFYDDSEMFDDVAGAMFGFLDVDFEVYAWIDADNRVRRLSLDIADIFGGASESEDVPSTVITVDFVDYDTGIEVEAPPPEVIVDDPSVLRGDDDFAYESEYQGDYDDDYDDDDYDDDDY